MADEKPLSEMTNDELVTKRVELGRKMNWLKQEMGKLHSKNDRIRDELKSRDPNLEIEVSDHAVLRYLERAKGIDINAIRQEIRENILAGNGDVKVKGRAEGVLHDGLVYVVVRGGNAVATVFEAREYQVRYATENAE